MATQQRTPMEASSDESLSTRPAVGGDSEDDRPPGLPPLGRVVRWSLITLLLWLLGAGYLALDAQRHARNSEDSLRRVADVADGDLDGVDFAAVEADLVEGSSELSQARRSISSPVVRVLSPIPIVGRQLASARALISTSDDLADSLIPLVASARTAQNEPNALDRVAFLQDTSRDLAELQQVIDGADLGPAENLVGPLADARLELSEQLSGLAEDAAEYEVITGGLASFFGDSTYLVLGANNAEMQLGGGMPLSVGRAVIVNGDFDLPGLEPAASFFPVDATPVVDADVEARWGSIQLSNDFRKLNYTIRFDEFGGPQALDMWEADSGERLDGVLMLDPFVLDAILSVVGDVEVEGEVYGPGDTLIYLLQDQYAVFDDGDDDAGDLTDERRDRLSLIANAAVEQLTISSWDPLDLVEALRPLARGRHLLVYSSRPQEQAAWQALGVDGSVPANSTAVALINNGGAKLDPFMRLTVDAAVQEQDGQLAITYEIAIVNEAPATGLPRYTVGPWRSVGLPSPGTYSGQLAVLVPDASTTAGFGPSVELSVSGVDGQLFETVTRPFQVPPGGRIDFQFEYSIADSLAPLRLIPSARFPATAWTWSGRELTDRVAIDLD